MADLVAGAGVVGSDAFLRAVADPALGRALPVVGDRPAEAGLEGYLFPDTYEFAAGGDAVDAVQRMLAGFVARASAEFAGRGADATGEDGALSDHDAVILASIVEREAVVPTERARIARVYLNRLATPPYLLQADPTVQYGLGFQSALTGWWKRPLTVDDLASPSAFNTYVQPGLPPGPIANPGLDSIDAVLHPEPGDWLYFVVDGARCDGSHVFSETLEEHAANVAAYRASGCGE